MVLGNLQICAVGVGANSHLTQMGASCFNNLSFPAQRRQVDASILNV